MITCTRRIQFCAGHRVRGHEGKCKNMHGHNYVALFTAQAGELDAVGRVIDFSVLKERVGGWIDKHWDHGFIYWDKDIMMQDIFTTHTGHQKHFELPLNPTAENMAHYLLHVVCPEVLIETGVTVIDVTLWETENCFAKATL